MRTQRRTHRQHRALLDSRWMHKVSCYRITTAYLMVATVAIALLMLLTGQRT